MPEEVPLYIILISVSPFGTAKNDVKVRIIPYNKYLLVKPFIRLSPMLILISGSFSFFYARKL
jgi:hypothetical protein